MFSGQHLIFPKHLSSTAIFLHSEQRGQLQIFTSFQYCIKINPHLLYLMKLPAVCRYNIGFLSPIMETINSLKIKKSFPNIKQMPEHQESSRLTDWWTKHSQIDYSSDEGQLMATSFDISNVYQREPQQTLHFFIFHLILLLHEHQASAGVKRHQGYSQVQFSFKTYMAANTKEVCDWR